MQTADPGAGGQADGGDEIGDGARGDGECVCRIDRRARFGVELLARAQEAQVEFFGLRARVGFAGLAVGGAGVVGWGEG